MRCLALLALLSLLAGCSMRIDRDRFDQLYEETALSEGVYSSVPPQIERDAPPVVVNWLYAGTEWGEHRLVFRELTWDANGKPVGKEKQYRINSEALTIAAPFPWTQDSTLWQPLYEAAPGQVDPPLDLPTRRSLPGPIDINPTQRPTQTLPTPPTD